MPVEVTPTLWNLVLGAPLGDSCTSRTTDDIVSLNEEPRRISNYGVISNECGGSRCQRPKPQTSDPVLLDLCATNFSLGAGEDKVRTHPVPQQLQTRLSLSLERGFESVNGGQDNPKPGGAQRSKNGLNSGRELLHERIGLQEGKDTRVCRGITKTGHRPLNQSGGKALIVARITSVGVQGLDGFRGCCAIAVLVVHCGA